MSPQDFDDLCNLLIEIEESGADLAPKDKEFYLSQKARVDKWGSKVPMSDAQMKWLRDLHLRATL